MADMMADAAAWLTGQRTEYLSQTVALIRGGKTTSGVKATKCPPRSESEPTVNVDINNFDWIIATTEYVINSVEVEPQKNDVIQEADGQKHQLLPLDNEPEFRFSDQFGTAYRIHTKRIKEAT